MSSLAGKTGLIVGVANKRSIAWAIAQAASSRRRARRADLSRASGSRKTSASWPTASPIRWSFRSTSPTTAQIARVFEEIERDVRRPRLRRPRRRVRRRAKISSNPFVQTTRDGFKLALDVSAYSLIALARGALPLMEKQGGGSILTLTYLGSERVFQNYNVMGVAKAALESTVRYLAADLGPKNIRVNAISAGPIKTLAAAGISGFSNILQVYRDRAPLRRTVETAEVADAAMFLLSDAGRAVTAEVLMVDGGYHAIGM